jgi:hypothetical protein
LEGDAVVILLSFAAIVGAVLTFLGLLPVGWGVALLSAPFGGSLAAVALAKMLVSWRNTPELTKRDAREPGSTVSASLS